MALILFTETNSPPLVWGSKIMWSCFEILLVKFIAFLFENASDELKDLSNFKLRTRRKQLKQQLARALGMLGIPEAKFHGLASRKQIDEVGLQRGIYLQSKTKAIN